MQRSNSYILIYILVLTSILAVLLSVTSEALKPLQEAEKALEQKRYILSSAIGKEQVDTLDKVVVEEMYTTRVKGYVINSKGEVQEGQKAEDVNLLQEYKKKAEDRFLPVFEISAEADANALDCIVFPLYGYGLWDNINGYVALEKDLNTIRGLVFDHVGETPGLGARIRDLEIQQRFFNKEIFDEQGVLIGVKMMKGEGNDYSGEKHKVDGMSGATITGNGLNNMIFDYFTLYETFITTKQKAL